VRNSLPPLHRKRIRGHLDQFSILARICPTQLHSCIHGGSSYSVRLRFGPDSSLLNVSRPCRDFAWRLLCFGMHSLPFGAVQMIMASKAYIVQFWLQFRGTALSKKGSNHPTRQITYTPSSRWYAIYSVSAEDYERKQRDKKGKFREVWPQRVSSNNRMILNGIVHSSPSALK
jgi:hypothetical protein